MTKENEPWTIRFSEKAKDDLKSIVGYVRNVLLEPEVAGSLYQTIMQAICSLDTMPFRFHLYRDEPWKSRGLRVMKTKNFLVFYLPDKNTHTTKIVRIMYAGRDINKQLH